MTAIRRKAVHYQDGETIETLEVQAWAITTVKNNKARANFYIEMPDGTGIEFTMRASQLLDLVDEVFRVAGQRNAAF
jgi:hypothetical protein